MKSNGALLWIAFLLAALFIGPAIIVRRMSAEQGLKELRAVAQSEELRSAPANVPDLPPAVDEK